MAVIGTKTWQRPLTLYKKVSAAEETANSGIITVSNSATTDEFVFVAMVKRAGVDVTGFRWQYETTSGVLAVYDDGSASLTSGDIITVIGTYLT